MKRTEVFSIQPPHRAADTPLELRLHLTAVSHHIWWGTHKHTEQTAALSAAACNREVHAVGQDTHVLADGRLRSDQHREQIANACTDGRNMPISAPLPLAQTSMSPPRRSRRLESAGGQHVDAMRRSLLPTWTPTQTSNTFTAECVDSVLYACWPRRLPRHQPQQGHRTTVPAVPVGGGVWGLWT